MTANALPPQPTAMVVKNWEAYVKKEWLTLYPGLDYPREMEWMEVRKLFGGALMAVGMD
ncbi:hypothetical protein LTR08_006636 [Meristemomyces frigidus]|nr:hypothetical protein LTR08_006636 [Meristemomyces frigidus]